MGADGGTELEGDIEGRGEQAGPSGDGHGGATCQNLPDLIPHSSTLCAADLWGTWDTASVWGEGPHTVWLALTAEAGFGVGPMKGVGQVGGKGHPTSGPARCPDALGRRLEISF